MTKHTTEPPPIAVSQGEKLLLALLEGGATVRDNDVDGRRWVRLSGGGMISLVVSDWDSLIRRGWASSQGGGITDQGRRVLGRCSQ